MENFIFQNGTKIIFGKGTEEQTGSETALYGKKVLFHYGGGSIKKTGLYDKIVKSLNSSGVDFIELGGVKPNPELSLVHKGIDLCREKNIDFILAVGGGSVIDSAKAIAAGFYYEGDIWDAFVGKGRVEKALPVGVVLTIPAAGSETSTASVITNKKITSKQGMEWPVLRPVFAIMNPEVTYTLPAEQTAYGITDMIAHVMERYFTSVENNDLTDHMCEAVIKSIINNAPKVLDNPEDYNARAEIMLAGMVAHNDSLNMGRIGDWASHGIEHELSAFYGIAHGAGLAVIFPAWLKYVSAKKPEKVIQFASRIWGVEYNADNPQAAAAEGIKRLENFFRSMGLAVRLGELGIDNSKFEIMAEKAVMFGERGNYIKLGKDDVLEIYKLAE